MVKPELILNGTEFAGSRSKIPEETRQQIVSLAEGGVGRNEIVRRTGLARWTVSTIAAAAGLGFAEAARTDAATQARIVQLRERRVDQAEHLHLALEQATALLAMRMLGSPQDSRGIADSSRAVRDLSSAYRALAAINARALGDFATEAAYWAIASSTCPASPSQEARLWRMVRVSGWSGPSTRWWSVSSFRA